MSGQALEIASESAMLELGERIGGLIERGDLVALSGDLGAGKTVLARGILAGLGHRGEVTSPSYALVHPYDPPDVRSAGVACRSVPTGRARGPARAGAGRGARVMAR